MIWRAFGDAWARHHSHRQSDRRAITRALTALAENSQSAEARAEIFARAAVVVTALHASDDKWAFVPLLELARRHPPVFTTALSAIRAAVKFTDRREVALDCLASLVGSAPEETGAALFDELATHVTQHEGAYQWPARLATAAPQVARTDPQRVLAAAASVHPHYAALAYALVVGHLSGPTRAAAITAALANGDDPSLGDARPYVALAPHLDQPTAARRAVELARRLYPSRSFGATAMMHLLPRLAALGDVAEALRLAAEIPLDEERGVALANIAPHLSTPQERDDCVATALALLASGSGDDVAAVAPALVPLGYGALLSELRGAKDGHALFVMMMHATDYDERLSLAARVAEVGEPAVLVRAASASATEPMLPVEVIAPRLHHAILESAQVASRGGALLEDETGYGLLQWLPLVPVVCGDATAIAIASRLAVQ